MATPRPRPGVRHQWPTSEPPFSRSEPERCARCGLLRRAVAAQAYEQGRPERYYWRFGEGAVEGLARSAGRCPGEAAQHAEVAHAA